LDAGVAVEGHANAEKEILRFVRGSAAPGRFAH